MWCLPKEPEKYNTFAEIQYKFRTKTDAQDACNEKKEKCKVFYETRSESNAFVLCGPPYQLKQSDYFGSTLYSKCKILYL